MLHAHRQHAVGSVIAERLAFGAHADLLEVEELLELDLTVFDAGDLGDAHDPAHPTAETRLLNDEVARRADRLADGPRREIVASIHDKRHPTRDAPASVLSGARRHR